MKWILIIALSFSINPLAQKQSQAKEQLNYDEPYNLIELLKLPDKTEVEWKPGSLPSLPSYKIFLGSRYDFAFEKEIKIWAEKWNEKEGKKFGEVTIVAEIVKADVVLARYQNLRELVEETVVNEPSLNPNVAVNTMKTKVLARPQYSYILLPKDKKLEIIWRGHNLIRQGEKPMSNIMRRDACGFDKTTQVKIINLEFY